MLKVASVFSGIGSFENSLIKNKIKHKVIFACDIDKYCRINYLNNYETKKFYDDIKEIDGTKYKNKLDLLVAGCSVFRHKPNCVVRVKVGQLVV